MNVFVVIYERTQRIVEAEDWTTALVEAEGHRDADSGLLMAMLSLYGAPT